MSNFENMSTLPTKHRRQWSSMQK